MTTDPSTKTSVFGLLLEKFLKEPAGLVALLAIVLGGLLSLLGVQLKEDSIKALAAGALLVAIGLGGVVFWAVGRWRRRGQVDQDRIKRWIEAPTSAAIRGALSFNVHDDLPGEARRRLATKIAAAVLDPGFQAGVVYGKPGVGKTSLLFAGVARILNQRTPPARVQLVDCRTTTPVRLRDAGFHPIAPPASPSGGETVDAERVVIVDQFEDWLVPAAQTGDFSDVIAYLNYLRRAGIRLILGIRYDHAGLIASHLQDTLHIHQRFWEPVQPLSTLEATQVIRECIALDKLDFPAALPELVANDLSHEGVVWPVELQIVLYELLQEPSVEAYRRQHGAAGILSEFIRGTVLRSADHALTRDILRMLTTTKDAVGLSIGGLPTYHLDTLVQELRQAHPNASEQDVRAALRHLSEHRIIGEFRHEGASKQLPVYRLTHDYLRLVVAKAIEQPLSNSDNATQLAQTYLLQKDMVSDFEAPISGLRYAARYGRREVVESPPFRDMYRRAWRRSLLRLTVPPTLAAILTATVIAILGIEVVWDEKYLSESLTSSSRQTEAKVYVKPVFNRVIAEAGPRFAVWDTAGKSIVSLDTGDDFPDQTLMPIRNPWVVWRNAQRYTFLLDIRDGRKLLLPPALKFADEAGNNFTYVQPIDNDVRLLVMEHSCQDRTLTVSLVRPGETFRIATSRVVSFACWSWKSQGTNSERPEPTGMQSRLSFKTAHQSSVAIMTDSGSDSESSEGMLLVSVDQNDGLNVSRLSLTEEARDLATLSAIMVAPFYLFSTFFRNADGMLYDSRMPIPTMAGVPFLRDAPGQHLLFTRVESGDLLTILELDLATGQLRETLRQSLGLVIPGFTGTSTNAQLIDVQKDAYLLAVRYDDEKTRLVQRTIVHLPRRPGLSPRAFKLAVRDKLLSEMAIYDAKENVKDFVWQAQIGDKTVLLTTALEELSVSQQVVAVPASEGLAYADNGKVFMLDGKNSRPTSIVDGISPKAYAAFILNPGKLLIAEPEGRGRLIDIATREVTETRKLFIGAINKYDSCGSMMVWYSDGSTSRFTKVLKIFSATVWQLNSCAGP